MTLPNAGPAGPQPDKNAGAEKSAIKKSTKDVKFDSDLDIAAAFVNSFNGKEIKPPKGKSSGDDEPAAAKTKAKSRSKNLELEILGFAKMKSKSGKIANGKNQIQDGLLAAIIGQNSKSDEKSSPPAGKMTDIDGGKNSSKKNNMSKFDIKDKKNTILSKSKINTFGFPAVKDTVNPNKIDLARKIAKYDGSVINFKKIRNNNDNIKAENNAKLSAAQKHKSIIETLVEAFESKKSAKSEKKASDLKIPEKNDNTARISEKPANDKAGQFEDGKDGKKALKENISEKTNINLKPEAEHKAPKIIANNNFAQQITNADSGKSMANAKSVPNYATVRAEEIIAKSARFAKNVPDGGSTQARLMLKPPSLGNVVVDMSMKSGVLQMNFKAETYEAAKIIEGQLIILKDKLSQQGIKTESVEVRIKYNDQQQQQNNAANQQQHRERNGSRREYARTYSYLAELNQMRENYHNTVGES